MAPKQAACDPCRLSKLACDHAKPVCGRCRRRGQTNACLYRAAPFQNRRSRLSESDRSVVADRVSTTPQYNVEQSHEYNYQPRHHPNPGYLGLSSHTTIFEQLSPTINDDTSDPDSALINGSSFQGISLREGYIKRGQALLEEIKSSFPIKLCVKLVDAWIVSGANLALAKMWTMSCLRSIELLLERLTSETANIYITSVNLFEHSGSALLYSANSTSKEFGDQFSLDKTRWETLGIFFTAVSRATIDIKQFKHLYMSQSQRSNLRKTAKQYSDMCLDLCLDLDCLNDLQLILQYENFINHSCTDGDQSYHSWKRLGDVISSLYALGYHTENRSTTNCPKFLQNLRETTFAFTYSADKNVSIFLGRPPRMHRTYCSIDFLDLTESDAAQSFTERTMFLGWDICHGYDYSLDAWWSMTCALQKERSLDLFRESDKDMKQRSAQEIEIEAERSWLSLPPKFRLACGLMAASASPIERDFLASARLNHLHVFFLIRLAISERMRQPALPLLNVSIEILSIVVQVAILKDHLVNSGTGTVWKIAYYGLPAAAILCLSLLDQTSHRDNSDLNRIKVFQDLSVLIAEIDTGGLVDPTDPNFALLSKATKIIKKILDTALSRHLNNDSRVPSTHTEPVMDEHSAIPEEWLPWSGNDNLDFEIDFWTNLGEHPELATG